MGNLAKRRAVFIYITTMHKLAILLCICLFNQAYGRDICYGVLGCFTTEPPFYDLLHRPISLLPDEPGDIDTTFYLFTQETLRKAALNPLPNDYKGELISSYDVDTLEESTFDQLLPIKFIVHGYLEQGKNDWMIDMMLELLLKESFNVILVDWMKGSVGSYSKATANSQVVGAEIAYFIERLEYWYDLQPEDMHVIGFSLGAHAAGYAGERLFKLGRITGLDPSGQYFEKTDPIVKLDPTDANFIDVIHTDAESLISGGYGIKEPVGHVDFYPNGGKDQQKCVDGSIIDLDLECSHLFSTELFNVSINSQFEYIAYGCANYNNFLNGACLTCSGLSSTCGILGYNADQAIPRQDKTQMYLLTDNKYPYEAYITNIQVKMGVHQDFKESQSGSFFVTAKFYEGNRSTSFQINENEDLIIKPNTTYGYLLNMNYDIGDISNIEFWWKYKGRDEFFGQNPAVWFDKITTKSDRPNGKIFEFCGNNEKLEENDVKTMSAVTSCDPKPTNNPKLPIG